jgi:hypothetical protein
MAELPASSPRAASASPDRWQLIRDVLVFQAKLLVDGLRDLLLSPVSLIAALADLLLGRDRGRPYFYELVLLGRRSEAWIDLFGAGDRVQGRLWSRRSGREPRLEDVFAPLEQLLKQEVERGGITASAKQTLDRWLDGVQRASHR